MRLLLCLAASSSGIAFAIRGSGVSVPAAMAAAIVMVLVVLVVALVVAVVDGKTGHESVSIRQRFGSALAQAAAVSGSFLLGFVAGGRGQSAHNKAFAVANVVDVDTSFDWIGTVATAPDRNGKGSRLRVRMMQINGRGVQATASVSVIVGVPDILPGDRVRIRSKFRSVRGTANPGVADPGLQMRAAGIDVLTGVGKASDVILMPTEPGRWYAPDALLSRFLRFAALTRRALAAAIQRTVSVPAAREFLNTAVLGQRRQADPRVEDGFRAAGATHVLSVSGLHLAVIAAAFFSSARAALRAIPKLPLFVSPAALAAILTIPTIWFYSAITGSAVATVRAALMMTVAFAGHLVGRKNSTCVAIAAAGTILTLDAPLVIFDISYQLSMISVLALALLVPRLEPTHPDAEARRTLRVVGRAVFALGTATLVAGVVTAPVVAHHFGEVTPAAPLGNLLLVPLVESIIVPVGLVGATLGAAVGDWAGWIPLTVASWTARLVLFIADGFRRAAPVLLTRAPNGFETFSLVWGAGIAVYAFTRAKNRKMLLGAATVCLALGFGSLWWRDVERRSNPNLIVTFLDVGQGDSAVVQIPGGRTLLVDAGGTHDGSFDPGARIVEPFLRAAGILHIDIVALSHPHADHMGGLHRVIRRFGVDTLWTSGDDGDNSDYGVLMNEAAEHGVSTPVPATFAYSAGLSVEPLGPFVSDVRGERIGPPEGASVNDASLVLRISYGRRALLLTGDLEAPGEGELAGRIDTGQRVDADVLKVPHHGSRTSSSDELLAAVRPRLAVMSLGWRNRFQFPRPEVEARYRRLGIRVLRTDLHGAITVTVTPSGELTTQCQRGC